MHTYQVAMIVGNSDEREPEVLTTVEAVDHRDAMQAFFANSLHPRTVTPRQIHPAMVGDHGTNQDSHHGLHYKVDGVEYVVTDMDIITTNRRSAPIRRNDRRKWLQNDRHFTVVQRVIEGQHAGKFELQHDGGSTGYATITELAKLSVPATQEPIVAGRIMPERTFYPTWEEANQHAKAGQEVHIGPNGKGRATYFVVDTEPSAPHDDEHVHGDPMAAALSERTMAKVLSRPAHVPSLVMLDRDAAAQHLAFAVTDMLVEAARNVRDLGPLEQVRQALADYRETTR